MFEGGATKFAFNNLLLITFSPTVFKIGARNVFHWLADTPNKHVHCTCKFSRWNLRHYIPTDLLPIMFSVRNVTVHFILCHAPHIKITWVQVWWTWRPQSLAYYSVNKNALLEKQRNVWNGALSCWKRYRIQCNWTGDQDIVWWTHLVTQIFMCHIKILLLPTSLSQGWQNLPDYSVCKSCNLS